MRRFRKVKIQNLFFAPIFVAYCLSSIAGCAPVISKQLREQVAKELTLSVVAKNPEAYKGKNGPLEWGDHKLSEPERGNNDRGATKTC